MELIINLVSPNQIKWDEETIINITTSREQAWQAYRKPLIKYGIILKECGSNERY